MKGLHSVNSSSAQFHLMSSAAASTVLEIHDASSNSNVSFYPGRHISYLQLTTALSTTVSHLRFTLISHLGEQADRIDVAPQQTTVEVRTATTGFTTNLISTVHFIVITGQNQ